MLVLENAFWLLVAALLLDAVVGDPDWLWRRLPHPVVWLGKLIAAFDQRFNKTTLSNGARKQNGVLVLITLIVLSSIIGFCLQALAERLPYGDVLTIVIAAVFLAQNSLYRHVAAVRDGLKNHGLHGGRKAVSMIVGRDPDKLDEAGVSRAAIESCAENFSDGVVAPVFWFAVLGLPGLLAYKAVNTADSMIGHKNEKYAAFGWASARFDDLINLPASRLSGLFIAFAAPMAKGKVADSLRCIRTDANKHRSPNAGWPEAAMAGALDLALAGPRIYAEYTAQDSYLNDTGRKQASGDDIAKALVLLVGACWLQAALVVTLAVLVVV
ncbi:adenosylcobinamide-phosphate synthase CbiB [uncultured Roseibium sp.]|uniref:adenosylcobinamide-phosphate synthase CbiB n=1 Tax=uncultured Roseibium sp. TaxID=1936171 RepID=UPI00261B0F2A|nr:adenosylcobinamide-phosphate synthase CbiB [uncultured Roseibium sp.]